VSKNIQDQKQSFNLLLGKTNGKCYMNSEFKLFVNKIKKVIVLYINRSYN